MSMNTLSKLLRVLTLAMVQVLGDTKAILVSVSDDVEYGEDSKPTGKVLGVKYGVVCPAVRYMPLTVKVPTLAPIITQEQIDATAEPIWITFDGFIGRLYQMRGELGITCKADKAILVRDGGKGHDKVV